MNYIIDSKVIAIKQFCFGEDAANANGFRSTGNVSYNAATLSSFTVLGLFCDFKAELFNKKINLSYLSIGHIASLRINLSLKTVQLSPLIVGHFCEYIMLLFCP